MICERLILLCLRKKQKKIPDTRSSKSGWEGCWPLVIEHEHSENHFSWDTLKSCTIHNVLKLSLGKVDCLVMFREHIETTAYLIKSQLIG